MVEVSAPGVEEVAALDAALDRLSAAPLGLATDEDVLQQLRELERVRRRVEAAGHARVSEVERRGLAQQLMCRSTAALLSEALRIAPGEARRRVKDAGELAERVGMSGQSAPPLYPQLAALHAAGQIGVEHVRVVSALIDRLPEQVAVEHAEAVETTLSALATQFHPAHLAVLARRIEALLHPDGTYRDEAEQQRRRDLRLAGMPDGTGRLDGWLTGECLALWQAVMDVLAAPAPGADGERDVRTPGQRLHDGLLAAGQILLRAGLLPDSAGVPATVQVTITAQQIRQLLNYLPPRCDVTDPTDFTDSAGSTDLTDPVEPGSWDTVVRGAIGAVDSEGSADSGGAAGVRAADGGAAARMSAPDEAASAGHTAWRAGGTVRAAVCPQLVGTAHGGVLTLPQVCRLLAEAEILPVFLTDTGAVMAYGRAHRLAQPGQRRALAARDRGCSFPGCTAPPAWCEVHHAVAWRLDGTTDLANLTLLCPFHHRMFEARGWALRMIDGVPWWIPPAWVDPARTARRNTANHLDQTAIDAVLERWLDPPGAEPDG